MIITILVLLLLLEFTLYLPLRYLKRPLAIALFTANTIAAAVLLISTTTVLSVLIVAVILFRLFNHGRIIKQRMHDKYLLQATRRTGVILLSVELFLLLALYLSERATIDVSFFRLIVGLQVLVALTMFISTIYNLRKTRHIENTKHYSDKELPTITIAIPARNETTDLEECLQSLLANDYPKLEILVLDDCSQQRTADIIKGFAHAGVRFIRGDDPDERWLTKNLAYEKLLAHANGELILFCGVDVRFGPRALRAIVTTMLNRNKSMLSVMPLRFYSKLSAAFVQPMRYWWELVPPRKLFNRPPVLSTCWIADRKQLEQLGGFAGVSRSILPEAHFAKQFIRDNSYTFIRADEELDIQTVKSFDEQRATAIRMRYPQVRRRPENVLLLASIELLFVLGPFVTLLIGILSFNLSLVLIAWFTCTLLVMIHASIVQVSNPANVPVAFINLPAAIGYELFIGLLSMYRYEFGTVLWKDRNVCVPVMHVVPKLPSITDKNH